jgi:hypothetical protein
VSAFGLWCCLLGPLKGRGSGEVSRLTRYHPVFLSVLPSLAWEVTTKRTLGFADDMAEVEGMILGRGGDGNSWCLKGKEWNVFTRDWII